MTNGDSPDTGACLVPAEAAVALDVRARRRKHALEQASELLAGACDSVLPARILDSLVRRERLGSTALGGGAALPHGRVEGLDQAECAFLRLEDPVEFEAPDGEPVDLVLAVVLPVSGEKSEAGDSILKALAAKLSSTAFCNSLRSAGNRTDVVNALSAFAAGQPAAD
jgi:PTS system nitrogen regulatory IIA component